VFHLEWKWRGGAVSATGEFVASGEKWSLSFISSGNCFERSFL
jgi:hypothetical protein